MMPIHPHDLPVKSLRELFKAYHDHTSADRKSNRERLIRRVGEKNVANTSLTVFELSVVAPKALHILGWETFEFVDIVILVGKAEQDDISKILELSQVYTTSSRRFNVVEVNYREDGPRTTCVTTVRRFRLEDVIRSSARAVVRGHIGSTATPRSQDDGKPVQSRQPRTIYQRSNSSCSTLDTEDFKSAVSRLPLQDRASLISGLSGVTYHTAQSAREPTFAKHAGDQRLKKNDEYSNLLQMKGLWPVDPLIEQDWSGRGQHAEFQTSERRVIDDILEVHEALGQTNTAVVESVRCRRILLARKSIWCGNGRTFLKKQQAIDEVAHLTRLSHAHIVRVIGTYVMGKQLSILLYPVADCNLKSFLADMRTTETSAAIKTVMFSSSKDFFGCIVSATKYIHSNLIKHMDIKPQNVLVQRNHWRELHVYTVLIADFGIARSYDRAEAIETDGNTAFTPKYAAPEVVEQGLRGLAADIFSLGCVLLELFVTLCDAASCIAEQEQAAVLQRKAVFEQPHWTHLQSLLEFLQPSSCSSVSYSSSIETVQKAYRAQADTLRLLPTSDGWLPIICDMISRNPGERPTATQLEGIFGKLACCDRGPCMLEVHADVAMTREESVR